MQEDFDAWNARADRFDGFDRGDLSNSSEDELQAKNEYKGTNAYDQAVALNKQTIVAHLAASGPQDFRQIRRELAAQAYADLESNTLALRQLVAEGKVEETIPYPESGDDSIVYELVEEN